MITFTDRMIVTGLPTGFSGVKGDMVSVSFRDGSRLEMEIATVVRMYETLAFDLERQKINPTQFFEIKVKEQIERG